MRLLRSHSVLLVVLCANSAWAQEPKEPQDPEVSWRIVLRSGAFLHGQLLRQDGLEVEIIDRDGNQVIVERDQVARVERLKGTVTAKVGEPATGEQARSEAREAGLRSSKRSVETLSDAEQVQRSLAELASKLTADETLSFAPEELGRGRWKWADRRAADHAGQYAYGEERPAPKQVREVGSLLYHLERIDADPGIVWIPYRWDPKRADWSVREFCPPALRAHRDLIEQRALLDRQAEALARVDARWRALSAPEASRTHERRMLDQTREAYDSILRRYLALAEQARAFVKGQVALPAIERVTAEEKEVR